MARISQMSQKPLNSDTNFEQSWWLCSPFPMSAVKRCFSKQLCVIPTHTFQQHYCDEMAPGVLKL